MRVAASQSLSKLESPPVRLATMRDRSASTMLAAAPCSPFRRRPTPMGRSPRSSDIRAGATDSSSCCDTITRTEPPDSCVGATPTVQLLTQVLERRSVPPGRFGAGGTEGSVRIEGECPSKEHCLLVDGLTDVERLDEPMPELDGGGLDGSPGFGMTVSSGGAGTLDPGPRKIDQPEQPDRQRRVLDFGWASRPSW